MTTAPLVIYESKYRAEKAGLYEVTHPSLYATVLGRGDGLGTRLTGMKTDTRRGNTE